MKQIFIEKHENPIRDFRVILMTLFDRARSHLGTEGKNGNRKSSKSTEQRVKEMSKANEKKNFLIINIKKSRKRNYAQNRRHNTSQH